jgi:hypothetical protein
LRDTSQQISQGPSLTVAGYNNFHPSPPTIPVLIPHDIIFPQIGPRLHFDQHHGTLPGFSIR